MGEGFAPHVAGWGCGSGQPRPPATCATLPPLLYPDLGPAGPRYPSRLRPFYGSPLAFPGAPRLGTGGVGRPAQPCPANLRSFLFLRPPRESLVRTPRGVGRAGVRRRGAGSGGREEEPDGVAKGWARLSVPALPIHGVGNIAPRRWAGILGTRIGNSGACGNPEDVRAR